MGWGWLIKLGGGLIAIGGSILAIFLQGKKSGKYDSLKREKARTDTEKKKIKERIDNDRKVNDANNTNDIDSSLDRM